MHDSAQAKVNTISSLKFPSFSSQQLPGPEPHLTPALSNHSSADFQKILVLSELLPLLPQLPAPSGAEEQKWSPQSLFPPPPPSPRNKWSQISLDTSHVFIPSATLTEHQGHSRGLPRTPGKAEGGWPEVSAPLFPATRRAKGAEVGQCSWRTPILPPHLRSHEEGKLQIW